LTIRSAQVVRDCEKVGNPCLKGKDQLLFPDDMQGQARNDYNELKLFLRTSNTISKK